MADRETDEENANPPSCSHNRQIQVRIIQIPPRNRGQQQSQPYFPDPADLLIQDGATASANIIRSATSLPATILTREIRLSPPGNSNCSRTSSDPPQLRLEDIPEHSEDTQVSPEADGQSSLCRCHVMRMADDTILWFVVNDVEVGRRQTRTTECPPSHSTVRSSESGPFCRICFLGTEDGPLLRVCHCRGTVGLVHHRCVLVWTMQRQSYSCEICHYAYNLQVNGLRWCWRWVYPVPRGQIATQCLLFTMSWVVMVFSIASLVFITFNLRTLFPDEITAGVFIIMNSFTLLCSIGILLTQSMYPIRSICQRFCLANLELEILPYDENDEAEARLAQQAARNQTATANSTNSQPYSMSSPNLTFISASGVRHPMSIPSVQLSEMVRSNQAVLGSLRDSVINNQTENQHQNQVPSDNRVERQSTWRWSCCIS